MVEFQHVGTFQAGYAANVTDLTMALVGGKLMLFGATHIRGGLSSYVIGAAEQLAILAGTWKYPSTMLHMTEPEALLIDRPGGASLMGAGLWAGTDQARIVAGDGTLGQADPGLIQAALPDDLLTAHSFQTAQGLSLLLVSRHESTRFAIWKQQPDGSLTYLSGSEPPPDMPMRAQIDSLCAFRLGGVDLIASASTSGNFIALHRVQPDGTLAAGEFLGSAFGTGFDGPRQLAFVEVDGRPFLIVNGAGSSSLTVIRVLPGGGLLPVEHVLDELTTRFQGAAEMAAVTVNGRTFVIVGGADDGLSLFTVTPAGQLLHLANVVDSEDLALAGVSALAAHVKDGKIVVATASSSERGVSQFVIDPGTLGLTSQVGAGVQAGTAGGDLLQGGPETTIIRGHGGDDVLIAGTHPVALYGGPGADRFVPTAFGGRVAIRDYEVGVDTIDLSMLGMIRSIEQLRLIPQEWGMKIRFGTSVIDIYTTTGTPLQREHFSNDMFPIAHYQPPYVQSTIMGTIKADLLTATRGGSTIWGREGDDTIVGSVVEDRLYGGAGNDRISAGAGDDTMQGDMGNDLIQGGSGRDMIFGGMGQDTIFAEADADRVTAGPGNDLIDGGGGDDTVSGGIGNDTLNGGDGNDQVFGEEGHDLLQGGLGNDTLVDGMGLNVFVDMFGDNLMQGGFRGDRMTAGDGRDTLRGGLGDDTLIGGGGNDLVAGGEGADLIEGGRGSDTLTGSAGNDTIRGDEESDLISGGADDDVLYGGLGDDTLSGDLGNDILFGDPGRDLLRGGDGADTLDGGLDEDTIHGGQGNDVIAGGAGGDVLSGDEGEDVIRGGDGSDTMAGGAGDDTLHGGADDDSLSGDDGRDVLNGDLGNDTLAGGIDDDTLAGGDGNDVLDGGAGVDELSGGTGNDTLSGGDGDDLVFGDVGDDVLSGGTGADLLIGGTGNDTVEGDDGDDYLRGGDGADVMSGGAGADALWGGEGNDGLDGGAGNDMLLGGAGNDTLQGSAGSDVLDGGIGNDLLIGGLGADVFRFIAPTSVAGREADVIADFVNGSDIITISDQAVTWIDRAAFSGAAGELRWTVFSGGVQAEVDWNGDAVADLTVTLQGVAALSRGDFLF